MHSWEQYRKLRRFKAAASSSSRHKLLVNHFEFNTCLVTKRVPIRYLPPSTLYSPLSSSSHLVTTCRACTTAYAGICRKLGVLTTCMTSCLPRTTSMLAMRWRQPGRRQALEAPMRAMLPPVMVMTMVLMLRLLLWQRPRQRQRAMVVAAMTNCTSVAVAMTLSCLWHTLMRLKPSKQVQTAARRRMAQAGRGLHRTPSCEPPASATAARTCGLSSQLT